MAVPGVPEGFYSRPSVARVRDAWLGGKDALAADRDEAARVEALFPPPAPGHLPGPREMAVRNRCFLTRAVTYAAEQGVAQFIDIGSGLPVCGRGIRLPGNREVTLLDTHQAARDVIPRARCVYVDRDPVVTCYARALSASPDGVAAVDGDPVAPEGILGDPQLRSVIDLRRPCCVVLGMALHFMAVREARAAAAAWVAALAPGSYLVISTTRCDDPGLWERICKAYTAAETWNHEPADVRSFFAGTTLVDPGVATARGWKAGWKDSPPPDSPTYVLCGVGAVKGSREVETSRLQHGVARQVTASHVLARRG